MTTYSGDVTYSNIKRVVFEDQQFSIYRVNPDPFKESLQLTISSRQDGRMMIKLISADGRIVRTTYANGTRGNNLISLNGLGSLTPGLYILEVAIGSETAREKL